MLSDGEKMIWAAAFVRSLADTKNRVGKGGWTSSPETRALEDAAKALREARDLFARTNLSDEHTAILRAMFSRER